MFAARSLLSLPLLPKRGLRAVASAAQQDNLVSAREPEWAKQAPIGEAASRSTKMRAAPPASDAVRSSSSWFTTGTTTGSTTRLRTWKRSVSGATRGITRRPTLPPERRSSLSCDRAIVSGAGQDFSPEDRASITAPLVTREMPTTTDNGPSSPQRPITGSSGPGWPRFRCRR